MRKYKVLINSMYDDADYCTNIDEQYTFYVEARNRQEAAKTALQLAQVKYGEWVHNSGWFEVAGVVEVLNGK